MDIELGHVVMNEIEHAGHYAGGGGHNLLVADVTDTSWHPGKPIPREIAANGLTYHSGYRDASGKQHWTFTKLYPLRGKCARCGSEA